MSTISWKEQDFVCYLLKKANALMHATDRQTDKQLDGWMDSWTDKESRDEQMILRSQSA